LIVVMSAVSSGPALEPEPLETVRETTGFEDVLINGGILDPVEKRTTNDEHNTKMQEEQSKIHPLQSKSLAQLEQNFDGKSDEDVLEAFRRRRIAELKEQHQMTKKAAVIDITEKTFEQEVKNAPQDGYVVLLLHRNNHKESDLMSNCVSFLAGKFPSVKWLRLVAVEGSIANFPLSHCPALLVYQRGEKKRQFATLSPFAGLKTTPAMVEWVLANEAGIFKTEMQQDPRDAVRFKIRKMASKKRSSAVRRSGKNDSSEDDDEDDSS